MNAIFDSTLSAKFYDPLYEVVVFQSRESERSPLTIWVQGERGDQAVTAKQFLSLIDTYEFSRLNFLRQAGLAWLEFPSATHTRFSHSLGCWLVSELASGNVFMKLPNRPVDRLGTVLRNEPFRWLEEFQLALLFHDIGHFPFSHVLENNDQLQKRYKESTGTSLRHEDVGCELILGGNSRAYRLFEEFIHHRCGRECDKSRFLSSRLRGFKEVDPRMIVYFISGDKERLPSDMSEDCRICALGIQELVSGVIDLDRIDHYHRDSHFIATGSEFNVKGLLNNLALVINDKSDRLEVQLIGDGIEHAFQMLYAKITLANTVFLNEKNLAYEIMLNHAINTHWENAREEFRRFLIFYNDSQLLHELETSPLPKVRKISHLICQRQPFHCAGKFVMSENAYESLGKNAIERRNAVLDKFRELLKTRVLSEDQCFIRFDKDFGKGKDETEWMDVGRILAEDGKPLSALRDHGKFVEFIRELNSISSMTFWLFVPEKTNIITGRQVGQKIANGC